MKKYIFLQLSVTSGEYEFSVPSVHYVSKRRNVDNFADKYARNFYGGNAKKETVGSNTIGYFFNGREVFVEVSFAYEITFEEFAVLNKFI